MQLYKSYILESAGFVQNKQKLVEKFKLKMSPAKLKMSKKKLKMSKTKLKMSIFRDYDPA